MAGTLHVDSAPTRRPWGKIVVVAVAAVLILSGLVLLLWRSNRPPRIIQTTASPPSPEAGDTITFTAWAADPDGDALSYLWDFGDGSSGTGVQPLHAYAIPGKFIAFVTVSDGKGGEATNEADLLRLGVMPKASDTAIPPACQTATCAPGPVVANLRADRWTAESEAAIAFDGNASWAYAFFWNTPANHSQGGNYSLQVASENATLFELFRYVWGDGASNTTGSSESVGHTNHAFAGTGSFFVWLTVTYVNADLIPSTKSAFAGFTVRVVHSNSVLNAGGSPFTEEVLPGPGSLAAALVGLLVGPRGRAD